MTLVEQYRQMHAAEPRVFSGMSLLSYAWQVKRWIGVYHLESLLDYGCGKAAGYGKPYFVQEWWGMMPALYDPAVPQFAKRPGGTFDGVLCIDVLEHVEEPDVPGTLVDLFSLADKLVCMTVCSRASSRTLPGGRNCHVTLKPLDWWEARVEEAAEESGKMGRVRWKLSETF